MFSKSNLFFVALSLLATSEEVLGRERWMERDNRPVYSRFARRRFGQEQAPAIAKLSGACPGGTCGNLAGAAIGFLLAGSPECGQQDHADAIIDASKQFDAATQATMIALAIEYRQSEKNTPPDFSTNPNGLRNSVFCQKAPKNPELNGLVQAQDPANDPNLFFDPATKATVTLGSQANTAPFGGAAAAPAPVNNGGNTAPGDATVTAPPAASSVVAACPPDVTVTVTATPPAQVTNIATPPATGGTTAPVTGGGAAIGDFGLCSIPEIEFGTGIDGRVETAFQPKDKQSFKQSSAQNVDIITRAICDTLTNTCKADQTAKDTCKKAQAAASAAKKGTGAQADAFNAVFGITTKFVDVTQIDNQGKAVPGTGNGAVTPPATAPATGNGATAPPATGNGGAAAPATGNGGATAPATGTADFGSCSTPAITFAVGLEGRRESAFIPTDKASFNHGSAQAIAIITRSICDTLTNTCKANQAAKDLCATATAAANAKPAKTGAQADAFNAVFGATTNFAAVQPIDDQGRPVVA